ncbi:hypothetical protein BW723_05755 [Polaribacter reichenbachii]|uniref:HTH luxR-type domain-containing protein n=1 Tax=Polaribacter reichenbachii TaxID=996801 RepID=A0A1B8TYJ1_9FLAO|nr:hypothetical protein [Polaribacter reichenbachii]APZ45831.1 hypothetical protein BW723_05755 [Polaribacter reichenbachii]AUC19693.1 hypothetical protein BTO17_13770 [Polaribacter reichenbachii]OBY64737.1 hypothetical protein LPB301_09955 [Polaribacter reichenbachii]
MNIHKTSNNFKNLLLAISFLIFNFNAFISLGQTSQKADQFFKKGQELKRIKPDSSVLYFKKSFAIYLKNKDTVLAVRSLLEKSYIFENNAQYTKSYDCLWKTLLLIDKVDNLGLKSLVYLRLGRIYSYYKREKESIKYLKKALEVQKELANTKNGTKSNLVPYYYAITATYRELDHPEKGKKYLDSCYYFFDKNNVLTNKANLDFEKANILSSQNKNTEALEIMEDIYPWFKENSPSYLVLFYKYWGDIYFDINDLNKSEELYLKSLKTSSDFNSHIDFSPLVYEQLAAVYLKKKNYFKAFKNIEKAKELDAKFFDSRSSENLTLLEIKDDYRTEKERQEKIIQDQYLRHLEQEEKITNLQNIILIGSIIFLLILGFIFFKNLRAKHAAEKELIRKTKEIEIQKTRELLELKNRELAASALQLIEKDEFLKDLKTKVREGGEKVKIHELNKVLRSVSVNNNKNWEEFRARFIEVNKDFYNQIFEKFPNLSQGDQKICALIKLNFSSKEMARLLGISVESVHTVRHRIRKKMKLPRSVNLEDYINSL